MGIRIGRISWPVDPPCAHSHKAAPMSHIVSHDDGCTDSSVPRCPPNPEARGRLESRSASEMPLGRRSAFQKDRARSWSIVISVRRESGGVRFGKRSSSGSAWTIVSWARCRASLARVSRLRRSCRSWPKGRPRPTLSPATRNWLLMIVGLLGATDEQVMSLAAEQSRVLGSTAGVTNGEPEVGPRSVPR